MSWGERSCVKPCRCPETCSIETCTVNCPDYLWDGVNKPDSIKTQNATGNTTPGPTDEPIRKEELPGQKTTTEAMSRNYFARVPMNRKARRKHGYKNPVMSRVQAEARRAAMPKIDIADVRKARELNR